VISDAKLRAHLLSTFHGLRDSNDGWVPTSDMNLGGIEAVHLGRIRTICEQLAEAALIRFKPLSGDSSSGIVGMSKITGHGSDVVEGLAQAKIALEFATSSDDMVQPETMAAGGFVADLGADVPVVRTEGLAETAPPSAEAKNEPAQPTPELFTLRPTLWGMSIDLKEAYRRIRRRFVG
jgi:hypothetical protein